MLRYGRVETELSGDETTSTYNRIALMAMIAGIEPLTRPCRVILRRRHPFPRPRHEIAVESAGARLD
jgi:hypothetical protein